MTVEKMKTVAELIQSLAPGQSYFSFEFFPPKTEAGTQNLTARIERMAKLGPLFVTVTWGAGGSTSSKSLDIAELCAKDLGLTTCLHLTCTNMDQQILDDALDRASKSGIRNILALRGDPPRGNEYAWTPTDSRFQHAVDLVKYIKERHGDEFCLGVAAYPEGHVDGAADKPDQNPEKDIPYLIEKVEAGADFVITQLYYDVDKFMKFEELLLQHDIFKKVPVIPGLMPINTYQSFVRAAKLSHASIPEDLMKAIKQIPRGDDGQVKDFGVKTLTNIIQQMNNRSKLVRGFHFYTLNLEKSVARILEKADMITESPKLRRDEHDQGENRVEPDSTQLEKPMAAISISTGKGELGREATWDDFPNGRFGNSKSPAYGEIDGYGPTLHVDNAQALALWGHPEQPQDISKLFAKHITNELEVIPWSDQKLSAETSLIQEELLQLNGRGLWTVASQPATGNCVKSTDKIFGWGPPNGHVFQKAFVEFFISDENWQKLKPRLQQDDEVSYYAGDSLGNFDTNLEPGSSNVVTWGVFSNREILQSTIIEEESFKAWRDESFSIWQEWQRLYKPGTASARLLKHIHDGYHLVSVIRHDFFNDQQLWQFLLDASSSF